MAIGAYYSKTEEEVNVSEDENLEEVLNLQQRRKRAQVFRRIKNKLKIARARKRKKVADSATLMKRSRKAAREVLRRKLAGKMGGEYNKLSAGQKMMIDKKLEGKEALIGRIAQRLLPKVRQKEMARYKKEVGGVKESVEVIKEEGGAGKEGTDKLVDNLKKQTPEEVYESNSVYAIKFDKPTIQDIKTFANKLKNENIAITKATNRGIIVTLKDDDEYDTVVSIADETGTGIDIKAGGRL